MCQNQKYRMLHHRYNCNFLQTYPQAIHFSILARNFKYTSQLNIRKFRFTTSHFSSFALWLLPLHSTEFQVPSNLYITNPTGSLLDSAKAYENAAHAFLIYNTPFFGHHFYPISFIIPPAFVTHINTKVFDGLS